MASRKYLVIGACLLASVMADNIAFSEWPENLTSGQPMTLRWIGGTDAPATITLRKGPAADLHDVQVLTNDATNGEFTWIPGTDLQNADDYAFEIAQGDEINYTSQLPLSGGSDEPILDDKHAAEQNRSASATDTSLTSATDAATPSPSSSVMAAPEVPSTSGTTTEPAMPATSSDSSSSTAAASSTMDMGALSIIPSSAPSTPTASTSNMNTPFVGSQQPSSTTPASFSVQTGAGDRVAAPFALIAGSMALLLI